MNKLDIEKIDFQKLDKNIAGFENKWVAISAENKIVASGNTYKETAHEARDREVVLFKVPPLDVYLAP